MPNVGPKTALGVLSALSVEDLARAVERGDHARLGKVPGIGKKTAERLVLEPEKLRGLEEREPGLTSTETLGNEASRLLSALTNMGYRPGEAERAAYRPLVRSSTPNRSETFAPRKGPRQAHPLSSEDLDRSKGAVDNRAVTEGQFPVFARELGPSPLEGHL